MRYVCPYCGREYGPESPPHDPLAECLPTLRADVAELKRQLAEAVRERDDFHAALHELKNELLGRGLTELDIGLLRKFAEGVGGRRTGALMRAGLLEVRVTDAGLLQIAAQLRAERAP